MENFNHELNVKHKLLHTVFLFTPTIVETVPVNRLQLRYSLLGFC